MNIVYKIEVGSAAGNQILIKGIFYSKVDRKISYIGEFVFPKGIAPTLQVKDDDGKTITIDNPYVIDTLENIGKTLEQDKK